MKRFLLAFLGGYDGEEGPQDDALLLDNVKKAREEWYAAQNYFNNVSDPELVDYAIYKVEEARRKYMYLLNLAKKEGLVQNQVI
ncbi:MAG TPA: YaaL family protein [Candidatus Atribacteria bacterium]|nr:YaaL family protein [Candidatus Atribacteria bacterium]